jgi:hypothetical protein
MVLVMARQEAGPCEKWPMTLNEELENNSMKGPSQGHIDSLKKVNLLFHRVRRRRNRKLLMVKMMMMR